MADVLMPQLGETVTEGTVTAWLKEPGDRVALDEDLFEVSTDKVDTSVPSPFEGTLSQILVEVGETVPVGTCLAVIGDRPPAVVAAAPATSGCAGHPPVGPRVGGGYLSPAVRRLVRQNSLGPTALDEVTGSGHDGRITREDIVELVQRGRVAGSPESAAVGDVILGPDERRLQLSPIRRRTGSHLAASLKAAVHTFVAVEVDYSVVDRVRRSRMAEFRSRNGTNLTYLPFVARAVIDALIAYPLVNSRVLPGGEALAVPAHVNLGLAVDLDHEGLVVVVLRKAERLRVEALAVALAERAERARSGLLQPDDVTGATFTISNPGAAGTMLSVPIIPRPQVGILATDGVRPKPVAVALHDSAVDEPAWGVAVHPVGTLGLSFDHQAFDGAYAAAFLATVRRRLEEGDWEAEIGPVAAEVLPADPTGGGTR